MGYIMGMDFDDGLQLIDKAFKRRFEKRQWDLYCSAYPHFTKENFVTFDQFMVKQTVKVSPKTKEQIREETKKLKFG